MIDEVNYLEDSIFDTHGSTVSSCSAAHCDGSHLTASMAPAEEIQLHLLMLGDRLRQHVAEVGQRFELTPQQAMLLDRLAVRQSMGQLAEALGCDPSNVTGMIRRLEQRDLVERVPDELDRRTRWLSLTPSGLELRTAFRQEIFRESEVLLGIDQDDQERFLALLRVLATNLGVQSLCG